MLDTGDIWLFVSNQLAKDVPETIQNVKPLTITLPMSKPLVSTEEKYLDVLIDGFIYM